jgi:hypothetical protein
MSAHQLASLPSGRVYWPFGFAHRIGPEMGRAVAAIFLRDVDPEVFERAGEPRRMVFYWDAGHGFRPAESALREYHLNHRGRTWQRFVLQVRGAKHHRYGASIGLPGEIVRLAGARVHVQPEHGEPESRDVPAFAISRFGYRDLDAGLFRVEADPPLLAFDHPAPDSPDGTVSVDWFFTVLPEA